MKADLELVNEVKEGRQSSFSLLVERHQRALLRLCFRFTKDQDMAEDVVQDAFIKAYQKIHMFEGRSSFKSWLFQIAVNTAKNKLRSKKNDGLSVDHYHLSVEGQAHADMELIDLKKFIGAHIDILPERQRTALVLRVYEDLSFKEISQIMDCPYDTAKANYRHAIMKLRHKFAEDQYLKNWQAPVEEILVKRKYTEVDQ